MVFCHKMTLRHLLTAFSLLHHFGELINGSPLKPKPNEGVMFEAVAKEGSCCRSGPLVGL